MFGRDIFEEREFHYVFAICMSGVYIVSCVFCVRIRIIYSLRILLGHGNYVVWVFEGTEDSKTWCRNIPEC